jgi:hypothetical protein
MSVERLLGVVQAIFDVHADEMDCAGCDAEMPHLAELISAGEDPSLLLPAVMAHLCHCGDCREEFDALVAVLRAEDAGLCLDAPPHVASEG